ncbi:hypothetical protein MTR04_09920, partial [Staphylococcus agnetis]|nr:hypothetical protein [Staphylococcus agnetis]
MNKNRNVKTLLATGVLASGGALFVQGGEASAAEYTTNQAENELFNQGYAASVENNLMQPSHINYNLLESEPTLDPEFIPDPGVDPGFNPPPPIPDPENNPDTGNEPNPEPAPQPEPNPEPAPQPEPNPEPAPQPEP